MLENLPSDVADHLNRTAQERIDMTRERLATAEATPVGQETDQQRFRPLASNRQ
jgi:hypothetical protein